MSPNDFVDLAARLLLVKTEAELRTAVSRAYYGSFHAAVQILFEAGISLPLGPESHQKVRLCLLQCGESSGIEAGKSLQSLRKERNIADYDLRDTTYAAVKNASAEVQKAKSIVQLLGACRQEPGLSRFRSKVREYAANVLRLEVK